MSLPPDFLEDFVGTSLWDTIPVKHLFGHRKEPNTGMKETHRLALTMGGVIDRSLDDSEGLQSSDYGSYQIFEKGDLAFKLIDLQNIKTSRVGLVPRRGIMSPAYIRLARRSDHILPDFYYWYFYAAYLGNIFNGLGGGIRQNLNQTELLEFPVPNIGISEQTAIANFLDRETTQIDGLIEKKGRFIALLKEKRAAVITHAVTKGVEPGVAMKSVKSRIFQSIPEAWRFVPLKHLGSFRGGAGFPDSFQGNESGDYPFFKVRNIGKTQENSVMCDAENYVSHQTAKVLRANIFPEETIFFAKVGAALLLNRFRISGVAACADNNMMGFMTDRCKSSPEFIRLLMSQIDFADIANPGTVPSINEGQVSNINVPLPDLVEQKRILSWLNAQIPKLDGLIAKTTHSIDLLKEKRSALITAAVTGKIDIRNAA